MFADGKKKISRSGSSQIVQEYVLPNYSVGEGGRGRTSKESAGGEEDMLRLGSERFAVPEVLFRPSDIGRSSWVGVWRRMGCFLRV